MWTSLPGIRRAENASDRSFPITVPLPFGKKTTLAGPHVEHLRSETHTVIFVGSKWSDWCVSCDIQLSLQAGHDYTRVRVYRQENDLQQILAPLTQSSPPRRGGAEKNGCQVSGEYCT
jgi:hypothetical protein